MGSSCENFRCDVSPFIVTLPRCTTEALRCY
jgi:hypothetical protein